MKRMQRWICVLCVGALLGSVVTAGADLLGIAVDASGDVMTVRLDQDGNGSEDLVVTGMQMGRVRVVDPLYIKSNTGTIAPVSAALQPTAPGARAALLDVDRDVDTGIANFGTLTLEFSPGCTNGPGSDIVLIELGTGEAFSVTINGSNVSYLASDFTNNLTGNLDFRYSKFSGSITNVAQLESSTSFSDSGVGTLDRAGIGIDLDDFGVGAGVVVTGMTVHGSDVLDLMFVGTVYWPRPSLVSIGHSGSTLTSVTMDQDGDGSGDETVNETALGGINVVDPLWLKASDGAVQYSEIAGPSIPANGQRAALLDGDAELNTGLLNIRTLTVDFINPAENGNGIDIVLIDAGSGDTLEVGINGVTNRYVVADFTTNLLAATIPIWTHRSTELLNGTNVIYSVSQLETNAFYNYWTGNSNVAGLGIDLSDFDVGAGDAVTTMQLIGTGEIDMVYIGVVNLRHFGTVISIK